MPKYEPFYVDGIKYNRNLARTQDSVCPRPMFSLIDDHYDDCRCFGDAGARFDVAPLPYECGEIDEEVWLQKGIVKGKNSKRYSY